MHIYTSSFLKQIIRILQTSRHQLNLGLVKNVVDILITSDNLLVIVNSLPLYIIFQMFFDPE